VAVTKLATRLLWTNR